MPVISLEVGHNNNMPTKVARRHLEELRDKPVLIGPHPCYYYDIEYGNVM